MSDEQTQTPAAAAEPVASFGGGVPELPEPPRRVRAADIRALSVLAAVIALVVLAAQWPVLSTRALWLDDDQYLTANPLVQSPSWSNASRFLTEVLEPSTVRGYYQPLTMISLMLDCALGGSPANLVPFHRTNLALHIGNVVLLMVLLYMLFRQPWAAALVALLYGLHPLTVEPLSWITERKTLLAMFFALWCIILYVAYVQRRDRQYLTGSCALCILALLTKPTTLPLPVLLLLLDYWPLRRPLGWGLVREKLAFLVVGGVMAVVTYISQSRAASAALPTEFPIGSTPQLIAHNVVFHLSKIVWPADLTPHYPFPEPLAMSNPMVLVSVLAIVALLVGLVVSLRWTRAVLVGGLIFLAALAPTLGVVRVTNLIACDKYLYLPVVGLLLSLSALLVYFWGPACGGLPARLRQGGLVALVLVIAGFYVVVTRHQLAHWRDTETLFKYMLQYDPDAPLLHNSYGVALANAGRVEEALQHYQRAAEVRPDYWIARTNTGIALLSLGRLDEAEAAFRAMADEAPDNAVAHFNLANTLVQQRRNTEAYAEFAEAVRLDPSYAEAFTNWGVALVEAGAGDEAIERLTAAVTLDPDDALAHYNLALALTAAGRPDVAVGHYHEVLRLRPRDPLAYTNLALTFVALNRMSDAERCFRAALSLEPNNVFVNLNLGGLALQAGRPDLAETHLRIAVQHDPENVAANNNLGVLLAQLGRAEESLPYLQRTVELDPDHANAQYMLGGTLVALGRAAEAIPHYVRALELQPADVEAHDQLAAAYAATGRFDAAIQIARQGLELATAVSAETWVTRFSTLLEAYQQGSVAPQAPPASQPSP